MSCLAKSFPTVTTGLTKHAFPLPANTARPHDAACRDQHPGQRGPRPSRRAGSRVLGPARPGCGDGGKARRVSRAWGELGRDRLHSGYTSSEKKNGEGLVSELPVYRTQEYNSDRGNVLAAPAAVTSWPVKSKGILCDRAGWERQTQ